MSQLSLRQFGSVAKDLSSETAREENLNKENLSTQTVTKTTDELSDEQKQKLEQAQKLFSQYVVGGRRIRTI